ncbi:MAG TPA: WG repeat-containing protein, partial [Bacteroidales bacterium]|nr:WG repeat-containing protein [Bacteroidales bacterium]
QIVVLLAFSLKAFSQSPKPIVFSVSGYLANYGVKDSITGVIYLPPTYNYINDFKEGMAVVKTDLDNEYGYIDMTGKLVTQDKFEEAKDFSEGLAKVKLNAMYGFIDKTGKIVIKPDYFSAESFSEGLAVVGNGSSGYIDKNGKVVIPLIYENAQSFFNGVGAVSKEGAWALIDKTGKLLTKFKYSNISFMDDGIIKVTEGGVEDPDLGTIEGGKTGFLDMTGKEIAESKYDDGWTLPGGYAVVKENEKLGLIDKTGKLLIPVMYDDIEVTDFFGTKSLFVSKDQVSGIMDFTGKELVPLKYGSIYTDKIIAASLHSTKNGMESTKWGFYSKEGATIVAPKYDAVWSMGNGLFQVSILSADGKSAKWGLVNSKGQEISKIIYDDQLGEFKEGMSKIILNGKVGFIDKNGKEVISPRFTWVTDFVDGIAAISIDKKMGFIDKTGKEITTLKYDEDYMVENYIKNGFIRIKSGDKYGFIDYSGKEITPVKYDGVFSFNEDMACVFIKDGAEFRHGFIDKTGKEVIPCIYSESSDSFDRGTGWVKEEFFSPWIAVDKSGNIKK